MPGGGGGTGVSCSQQGGGRLCVVCTWAEGLSCWDLLYPTAVPSAFTLLSHLTQARKTGKILSCSPLRKQAAPCPFWPLLLT